MKKPVSNFQRIVCAAVASMLMLQPAAAATYQLNVHVQGLGGDVTAPGTGLGDVDLGAEPVRARLQLAPDELRFEAQPGDGLLSQRTVLRNAGTGPAVLSGIASTPDFGISTTCVSPLPVNASCIVTAAFEPGSASSLATTNNVVITAAGATEPARLALVAAVTPEAGPTPRLKVSSNLVYLGTVEPGTSASESVTVSNVGSAQADLTGVTSGEGFSATTDCPSQLAVGASCVISARFLSSIPGQHVHAMPLKAASTGGTTVVTWYADVPLAPDATPALELSLTTLDFALDGAKASESQVSVLSNKGTAPAVLTGIAANSNFEVSSDCPTTLAEGAHCSITAKPRLTAAAGAKYLMSIRAPGSAQAKLLLLAPTDGLNPDGTAASATRGLTFTPASLSFGAVAVGRTTTLGAVLENLGDSIAALPAWTRPYGGEFTQTNNCGTSLAPGASCSVQVVFTPTSAGNQVDLLQVGRAELRLTGTGSLGQLVVSPTNLDFGPMTPRSSADKVLRLGNAGNLALTQLRFSALSGPFIVKTTTCSETLEAHQGCSVTIQGTAGSSGAISGNFRVLSGANTVTEVAMSGHVVQLRVTPNALTFSETPVGTVAAVQSVTVLNEGALPIALQLGLTAGTSHFSQSNNCSASLPGGASCHIAVQFAPTSAGTLSGELGIASGATPLARVALTGSGSDARLSMSSSFVAFEATNLSKSSKTRTVTLKNDTPTGISIKGVGIATGASDFAQSNNCGGELFASSSCSIVLQMTPTAIGERQGTLGIETAQGFYQVSLAGTGTLPAADLPGLEPPTTGSSDGYAHYAIRFLDTEYGKSSDVRNVTFRNIGTGPLAISGLSLVAGHGEFSQANNCGASLAPGAACTIAILFTPSGAGAFVGGIALHSETGKYYFDLTGKGASAIGAWTAHPSADFGMVPLASTSKRQFKLTNKGSAPATGVVTQLEGEDLTVVSNACGTAVSPVTLAAGASCLVTLAYAPSTAGSITNAALTATSGFPQPVSLQLSGNSPQPGLAFAAAPSGDYGTLSLNAPVSRTFTLRNTGKTSDTLTAQPAVSGEGFSLTGGTCTTGRVLAANASCTAIVTAALPVPGDSGGLLSASSTKGAGASVDLNGTAIQSEYVLSGAAGSTTAPPADFGEISVDAATPTTKTYYLRDPAGLTWPRAENISLLGDDGFKVTSVAVVTAPDSVYLACSLTAACQAASPVQAIRIKVQFLATNEGVASATLRIRHNGLGGVTELPLTGTGVNSTMAELSSQAKTTQAVTGEMGSISIGSPDGSSGPAITKTFYVRNAGKFGKLSVTPTLEGDEDFKLTLVKAGVNTPEIYTVDCGATISTDGTSASQCTAQDPSESVYSVVKLSVTFTAKGQGARKAKLTLAHNGRNTPNPLVVELTGTGAYNATASLSRLSGGAYALSGDMGSVSVDSPDGSMGAPVTKSIYVRNTGTYGKLGVTSTLVGDSAFTITKVVSNIATNETYTTSCGAAISADGSQASQCLGQDPGASGSYPNIRIDVTFAPKTIGDRKATLILTHTGINGPEPLTVDLTGTGAYTATGELSLLNNRTAAPTSALGSATVGGAGLTKTLYVRNGGGYGKLGASLSLTGDPDFTLTLVKATTTSISNTDCGAVIDASGFSASTCLADDPGNNGSFPHVRLVVTFKPTAKGPRSATLTVNHTGVNLPNPILFQLTGTGQ